MSALTADGIQDKVNDDKQDQSFSPPGESFRNNQNKHSNACNDKCPCDCKSLAI